MLRYILRRLAFFPPTLLGVSLLVFAIMHLTPGDPAQVMLGPEATPVQIGQLRHNLGLDRPVAVQFAIFVANAAQGDLGRSIRTNNPVAEEIASRFPATLTLAACGLALAVLLGFPLGLVAALRQNTAADALASFGALLGFSVPNFWLSLMLMLLLSVAIPVLPSSGYGTWQHLVLPALALGIQITAVIARMTRSSMLEVIRQDYVRTAHAKGIPAVSVLAHHSVRNALIPVVTIAGLYFGLLLGGVVVTETVFSYPGVGRMLIDAIRAHDYPLIQGGVLVFGVCICAVNLTVDILYAFLDPRIRAQYRARREAAA
jgi:peptide/nickel transport system permease protein